MKILAIRGENIASLERFELDFRAEPLRSAGIFAITGPTGSGKSTILDTLCLALFQEAPRLEGTEREGKFSSAHGDLAAGDIRHLLRRGATTGMAECEFRGLDGLEYRARWGYRAPKRKGSSVQEDLSLERLHDGQILVSGQNRKNEFGKKCEELLGFSYAQFTRTVLLAQGRFAEFLKAGVHDRAELLERLTGTGIFARISERIYKRKGDEDAVVADLSRRLGEIPHLGEEERSTLRKRLEDVSGRLAILEAERSRWTRLKDLSRQAAETAFDLGEKQDAAFLAKDASEVALQAKNAAETALRDELPRLREREDEIRRAEVLDERISRLREDSTRVAASLAEEVRKAQEIEERDASLVREFEEKTKSVEESGTWMASRERMRPVAKDWSRLQTLLLRCEEIRNESSVLEGELRTVTEASEGLDSRRVELQRAIAPMERRLEGRTQEAIKAEMAIARAADSDHKDAQRFLQHMERIGQFRRDREVARAEAETSGTAERLALEALDAVSSLVERSREAASEAAARMRRSLRPGEECPVCGSLEHPRGCDTDDRLSALFQVQDEDLRSRRSDYDRIRDASVRAKARVESIEARLKEEESLSAELAPPSTDLAAKLAGWPQEEHGDRLSVDKEAASARVRFLEELQGIAHDHLKAAGELRTLEERLASHQARTEDLRVRCDALRTAFEEAASKLDALLGGSIWRDRWVVDPRAWRDDMDTKVSEWNRHEEDVRACLLRIGAIEELRAQLAPTLVASRAVRDEASAQAARLDLDLRESNAKRRELLDGDSAEVARKRVLEREEDLRRVLLQAGDTHQAEQLRIAQLEGMAQTLRDKLAALEMLLSNETPSELLGMDAPSRAGELETRAATVGEVIQQRIKESERDRLALDADEKACASSAEIASRLVGQRAVLDRWARLSEAIGSSDGKKFRRIAQQFTLGILLEEGNRQLAMLAPRYELRRVEDTMAFGVVDREAWGEFRPVQTLSGGETFLVSLALALSLSRLSGSDHVLESLFIDEGFGTLDPETLRDVMNALSHLRSQGRQVGLITHVEELKELIPVRIEVEKMGGGASRLRVIG